jgi:predicted TIM-barrel fold metal-dependent hydrolase
MGLLRPHPSTGMRALRATPVVDVHAHFFNAADVPVRGFVEECLGHKAPPLIQVFLKAIGAIADRLADRAPTAADELKSLAVLVDGARLAPAGAEGLVQKTLENERQATTRRVVEAIRGSDFEQLYREAKARQPGGAAFRSGGVSPSQVRAVVDAAEAPLPPGQRDGAIRTSSQDEADVADGMLGFLYYMLSWRWANVHAYMTAYTTHPNAFGIDAVLGALVDFDYWLQCPPRSAQDDQVLVHGLLRDLYGSYFKPVVAYNPWSDINQGGAALARVIEACTKHGFVAVKIYPPMGFRPAGNSINPPPTPKARPDLKQLDATLARFFDECANRRIPVIAHTARSNGRDHVHDDFGGPDGWETLLARHAGAASTPIIDFGHFGGATWTQDFADLMGRRRDVALFGDLGYWDDLVCPQTPDPPCNTARTRLQHAMRVEVGQGTTVADRTMFATDWLMLSQMKRWSDYPARLHHSIRTIASESQVQDIFGGNATRCFNLHVAT